MAEPKINRSWYLGAAAGAMMCADADASIVYVTGPWDDNPSNLPIDIIQGDDVDPILSFQDAATVVSVGYVVPVNGPGAGVLRLWNTGQLIARSGMRVVSSGVGFYTIASDISFQGASTKGGALKNSAQVGTDNFIGFQVVDPDVNSGNPVYGWAQLSIPSGGPSPADAQILAFAYQDDGTGIVLGDTGIVIPEPSTLGLLALGATGLAALRRRKRSTSDS